MLFGIHEKKKCSTFNSLHELQHPWENSDRKDWDKQYLVYCLCQKVCLFNIMLSKLKLSE